MRPEVDHRVVLNVGRLVGGEGAVGEFVDVLGALTGDEMAEKRVLGRVVEQAAITECVVDRGPEDK